MLLVSTMGSMVALAFYLMFFAAVSLLAAQAAHRFVPGESLIAVRGFNA